MKKNTKTQNHSQPSFDESDFHDVFIGPSDQEAMMDVLRNLVESDRSKMQIAMELTRLIAENASDGKLKEKDILQTFKKSMETVSNSTNTTDIWKQMLA